MPEDYGGPFRDTVPAVASLSLSRDETLFEISHKGVGGGTKIMLSSSYRNFFKLVLFTAICHFEFEKCLFYLLVFLDI